MEPSNIEDGNLNNKQSNDESKDVDSKQQIHDSTSSASIDKPLSMKSESDKADTFHRPSVSTRSTENTFSSPQANLRFAARRNLPSLSNTNMRDCNMDDWPTFARVDSRREVKGDTDDKQQSHAQTSCKPEVHNNARSDRQLMEETDSCVPDGHSLNESIKSNQSEVLGVKQESNSDTQKPDAKSEKSMVLELNETDLENIDPSLQLYRYLKHRDLKKQISDLCDRENRHVHRQAYGDALRIREIKNELILMMSKNLYENRELDIDEELRKSALKIIEAREDLHKKRIKMSNSSFMYSEEEKELWKQWEAEDKNLAELESKTTGDLFQIKSEDDWENLASRDKQMLSQLYDRMMQRSDLQDEQKLSAAFEEACKYQMQYAKQSR